MENIWDDKYALVDLLLNTNKSLDEIAAYFECSRAELAHRIKMLDLDWIRRDSKKISRGEAALTKIMKKLLPGEEIVNQYHVGERLMLDVYCPKYKIAAEYHGRQHFFHIGLFHETYDDFLRAQARDDRKVALCEEQGITLIIFKYSDKLSEEMVFQRMVEAIRKTNHVELKQAQTYFKAKNHPKYEEFKRKSNAYKRDLRKKIKQEQKVREQNRTPQDEERYGLGEDPYGE